MLSRLQFNMYVCMLNVQLFVSIIYLTFWVVFEQANMLNRLSKFEKTSETFSLSQVPTPQLSKDYLQGWKSIAGEGDHIY